MRRKYCRLFIVFLLFCGFLAAAIVGFYWAAPGLIERHFFSPPARVEFHAWENDRIHLPAEALATPLFLSATQKAAAKFTSEWTLRRKLAESLMNDLQGTAPLARKRIDPETVNDPDLERRLGTLQPMIDAFAELVSQPDYTIAAAASGRDYDDSGKMPIPEYFGIQTNIKLLGLRAYRQVHAGKLDDAEKTVRLMLRATRVEPYDHIITTLIAVDGVNFTAGVAFHVMRHCDDKALLRRMLQMQIEQTRHPITFPDNVALDVVNSIGILREMRRRGIGADFQDKTGYELCMMCLRNEAEYIEKIVLPKVQNDPEMTIKALEEWQGHDTSFLDDPSSITRTIVTCRIYQLPKPNRLEAETRTWVAAGKFDLLALETAKKLYTLEHGKPPATIGALVPQYLPQVPRDRLADAAFLKDTPDRYYSIGPDKVDDHAALSYDPTNGAASAGDLFFDR